jgi:hypothetical protein
VQDILKEKWNDGLNPLTWYVQLLSYWFSRNPAVFRDQLVICGLEETWWLVETHLDPCEWCICGAWTWIPLVSFFSSLFKPFHSGVTHTYFVENSFASAG